MAALSPLFNPDTVAVIGATDREGSVGRSIIENLDRTFTGTIVPINPNREEVLGYPCVSGVDAAPDIDLAVIVLPAELVLSIIEDLAEVGVHHVVVISAGFGESGPRGAELERELVERSREYDMHVVGPNSLGIMSTTGGLNASFAPAYPPKGPVSMVSQSGAFVTAILDWATDRDVGFRHVVSLGNEAVIDETDVLEHLAMDPGTAVVMGYLEAIDDGRRFIDTLRNMTVDTPVVIVKAGRTEAGSRAASSHTGSIAGDDAAYDAGLRQAGVIRVRTVEELIDATRIFAHLSPLDHDSIAVVTNAGGPGVMATDAIGDSPLRLASLTPETIAQLEDTLPEDGSVYNPVDILGDATADRFADTIEIVSGDPDVGAVLVVIAPTGVLSFPEVATDLIHLDRALDVPLLVCPMGGQTVQKASDRLSANGIPTYFDPARAVFGLSVLTRHRQLSARPTSDPDEFSVDRSSARDLLEKAIANHRHRLGLDGLPLLDAYGIPTPPGQLVTNPAEAERTADQFDGPAALKVVSPDVTHKSDIGGVELGVEDDVRSAYERVVTNVERYQPDATIIGIFVQEMIDLDDRTETIVGAVRDPQFGPMVVFGLGGIFVETLRDTSVRIAPVTERDAHDMIDDLRGSAILHGARGRPAADADAIVEVVQRTS